MDEDPEVTPGGSRIERHGEAKPPELVPSGWDGQERIEEHVARHLGPIESVYHELISEFVHLDVLLVKGDGFRWLVTSGMSARPMETDDPADRYAELLLRLPLDWPVGDDERDAPWPLALLKSLARMPHEYGFAIGPGHTLPNGDPPEPYAPDTQLCCAMFAYSEATPEAFDQLEIDDGTVRFLAVYLMTPEEIDFKLENGAQALMEAFDQAGASELVEPGRASAVQRRKRRFGLF